MEHTGQRCIDKDRSWFVPWRAAGGRDKVSMRSSKHCNQRLVRWNGGASAGAILQGGEQRARPKVVAEESLKYFISLASAGHND